MGVKRDRNHISYLGLPIKFISVNLMSFDRENPTRCYLIGRSLGDTGKTIKSSKGDDVRDDFT